MTHTEYERTLQAVLFFALKTKQCSAAKLFKLVYLVDVSHFQQTGRQVTGLYYAAYTNGPVAPQLAVALEQVPDDLGALVEARHVSQEPGKIRHEVVPREGVSFNDEAFTPRQLKLMWSFATMFAEATSGAIDVKRFDGGAWAAAFLRGREEEIRMEEALMKDDPHKAEKLATAQQHRKRSAHLRAIEAA